MNETIRTSKALAGFRRGGGGMKTSRPVNDNEVLAELDRRTRGYGAGVRLAKELGLDVRRLHSIKSGNRTVGPRVAAALGWELRWVKKGHE